MGRRLQLSLRRKRKREEKNEKKETNEREEGRAEGEIHTGYANEASCFPRFCRDVLTQTLQQILRVEPPTSYDLQIDLGRGPP